jgi:adenosylcobinamide-GDP ribazoletransferase
MIRDEINIFFSALMFFTRIPCPKSIDYNDDHFDKSSRYFPLVGVIVGTIGAFIFYATSFLFTKQIAILLSMVSTVLLTGALHEDGLADTCDGFGGGWTKESILRIMKDSRLGTFGTIGLVMVLAIKFSCLLEIESRMIPLVLISSHALSRCAASTLLFNLDYVRDEANSKAKPAIKRMSATSLCISLFFGFAPLLFFKTVKVFVILIPIFAVMYLLTKYFLKWIGGQTGDCAGASQQICEVVCYLSFILIWKFI